MLNARDLKTYTAAQVASLADVDYGAVETEGARRQEAADRKRQRALKMMAEAAREMDDGAKIIEAAMWERAKFHRQAA